MTEKQFESHCGAAMGVGAAIGATFSVVTGLVLALLYLLLVFGRTGWSAEKKRLFMKRRGRSLLAGLALGFLVLACFKGIVDNWADFKEGVVQGYRFGSR